MRFRAACIVGFAWGAGCAGTAGGPTKGSGPAHAPEVAPTLSSAKLPALPALPEAMSAAPATSTSTAEDIASRPPFPGGDPYAPPPRRTPAPKLALTPPRAEAIDMSPKLASLTEAQCSKITSCGQCTNSGYCAYCAGSEKCVPRDRYGVFPGTCASGVMVGTCTAYYYFEHEEPLVRKGLAAAMKGMSPDSSPIDNSVKTGASTVTLRVERGYCYGVVLRVSSDLDDPTSIAANVIPKVKFVGDGGVFRLMGNGAGVMSPICPVTNGSIVASIDGRTVRNDAAWRVQLFRKPIAEADLIAAEEARETEERRNAVRIVCGQCARSLVECKVAGAPNCLAAYAACMRHAGVTEADCERGDVPVEPTPSAKPRWHVVAPPRVTSVHG